MKQSDVVEQLRALGVFEGGVLLVHTAFRNIRPLEGGIEGLIAALRAALGAEGTLVMPSMSDEDDQVFSPTTTACRDLGAVADTFWRMPGVQRSDSPHAFAAVGPQADRITAPHPPGIPHGLDSPVGRVYELDGQVLLLGVGHDANTTIHLAEYLAEVPYRLKYHVMLLVDGQPTRYEYAETDHCCERFALVDGWLDAKSWQRKGPVGHGMARLGQSQDIVRAALDHLADDKLIFLHPAGTDSECDAARASVVSR